MEYTIEAVSPNVREYDTKFGPMKSYKLKLAGESEAVELSQKASTPAPTVGSTLSGTISDTEYGKKFKKEYSNPTASGGAKFGGSKPQADPFTMYLSYAKDIAVALIAKGTYKADTLFEVVTEVSTAGEMLFEARNKPTPEDKPEPKPTAATDIFGDDVIEMPEDFLQ